MKLQRLSTFLIVASGTLLLADFAPSAWKLRKRIQVQGSPALASVLLDNQVYAGANRGLDDLRIVRGTEEIPYVLTVLHAQTENKRIEADLLNKSVTGAGALEFTLDMKRAQRHNRIELEMTRQNFRSRVKLDSSADGHSWANIRKEAYIFRYDADSGKIANLSIQYPDSSRRYLRATIDGWSDASELTGASLHQWSQIPADRAKVAFVENPPSEFDPKTKTTTYTVDLGSNAPKELLRIETGPGLFHRNVNIEHSDDEKNWSWAGSGALFRTAEEENLALTIPETRQRHLRLRIFQGDDKPIEIKRITAEGVNRRVTFPVSQPGDHWLYYGRSDAGRPSYDLPIVLAKSSLDSAAPAQLQPQEANAGYQAPPEPTKPWTDRNPALLYTTLGLAVAGLGYITMRFMKQAGPGGPAEE